MKSKLSLVTLGVSDFAKSVAFYRDGLGFTVHDFPDGGDIIFFEMGGVMLSLYPREKLAEDATVPAEGSGFRGVTLAHNVASEAEVDTVYAHALSVGAKPVKKPEKAFWGGYSGYFADPDGHLWEVAYNPFTDLT